MIPEPKTISKDHLDLGKRLLDDLSKKKLTMEEFENEVAYLAWDCGFDELRYKPYPSEPIKLKEYKELSYKDRKKVSEGFWRTPELTAYNKEYGAIEAHNCGVCSWLLELKGRFTRLKDTMRANVCDERLKAFPDRIRDRY